MPIIRRSQLIGVAMLSLLQLPAVKQHHGSYLQSLALLIIAVPAGSSTMRDDVENVAA